MHDHRTGVVGLNCHPLACIVLHYTEVSLEGSKPTDFSCFHLSHRYISTNLSLERPPAWRCTQFIIKAREGKKSVHPSLHHSIPRGFSQSQGLAVEDNGLCTRPLSLFYPLTPRHQHLRTPGLSGVVWRCMSAAAPQSNQGSEIRGRKLRRVTFVG